MISVQYFVFNDFMENTYVLWDETKECIIIDPGCHVEQEQGDLRKFIEGNKLKPVQLLNTHCHIDHILGNKWVKDTYGISLSIHQKDLVVLHSAETISKMYGIYIEPSPEPDQFLEEGDKVSFGNSSLDIFFHTRPFSWQHFFLFRKGPLCNWWGCAFSIKHWPHRFTRRRLPDADGKYLQQIAGIT